MNISTAIALAMIAVAATLNALRIVRRDSTLGDRALGLDTLLVSVVSGGAVLAARSGLDVYLDLIVATSLLGFLSTVTMARFMEARASR